MANQILDDMEISNIVSGGKSGYITAKILEKVKQKENVAELPKFWV